MRLSVRSLVSLGWLSIKILIVLYLMNGGGKPFIYQNF